ncbi:MAG: hypothetical protein KDA96_26535 [Planctomycetaceae bacterium]|nr:hypothetical protein [Planctomycetaceae bacterium]
MTPPSLPLTSPHAPSTRRQLASAMIACLGILITSSVAGAQDPPGEQIVLDAAGWPVHITYFEATGSGDQKEAPVVVLLAAAEGPDDKDARTRRVWDKTATALQAAGYAAVSVDLRKHGDSKPMIENPPSSLTKVGAVDYRAMVAADLEAVKTFLLQRHQAQQLNVRKLGIVAVGSSCMVASTFAVQDWAKKPFPDAPRLEDRTPKGQDVRAIIMFSPELSVKGLSGVDALNVIKGLPIAVYVFANSKDRGEKGDAEKIHKIVQLPGDEYKEVRKLSLVNDTASREQFLEGSKADTTNKDVIQDFLDRNLKSLNEPWRTRESRLTQ